MDISNRKAVSYENSTPVPSTFNYINTQVHVHAYIYIHCYAEQWKFPMAGSTVLDINCRPTEY